MHETKKSIHVICNCGTNGRTRVQMVPVGTPGHHWVPMGTNGPQVGTIGYQWVQTIAIEYLWGLQQGLGGGMWHQRAEMGTHVFE